ncbi:hypothetical protein scyTo_0018676 [Scyliorhinus torazame]|uniref:KATNIP domain-containing protein n=1 Tax=Scyliorhinus torazame TaxID=75743 RepID=A0A401Q0R0_SCYTO|nr:hypothetical protein [Scyliorhinus torazame]
MWLIPFTYGDDHFVTINFSKQQTIIGLRFWNYNKSPEDTYRGAKIVHVTLDGNCISPQGGFLLRKGPGQCHFDFAQEILFIDYLQKSSKVAAKQQIRKCPRTMEQASMDYEAPLMPCGFIFQLQLLTSWGDPYYIGLNGLEFYGDDGEKILLNQVEDQDVKMTNENQIIHRSKKKQTADPALRPKTCMTDRGSIGRRRF